MIEDKETTNKDVDYSVRKLNTYRLQALNTFSGHKVLDVGCGNGAYVFALSKSHDIHGADYARFDSWQKKESAFFVCDAQNLTCNEASYDTISAFETLEHLPEPRKALKEFHKACTKNIIITVPNCELTSGMEKSRLIFYHWIDRTHVNFWDEKSICQLVEDCEFKVIHVEKINNVSVGHIVMESLGLKGFVANLGANIFNRISRKKYPMTLLVVADKV